jgi:hypothetical protein
VTGVDAGDFAPDVSGITGASVTGVSGTGNTYTVTVSTGSGDGTVSIDLAASPTVSDLASNSLVAPFTAGEAFTLDRTAPVVSSITRLAAAPNPTNASSVQFTVTFSEPVTGVDAGDFAPDVSGITGASVTGVSGTGNTYTVTVSTGSGDGTVSIDLASAPTVSDLASNPLSAPFTAGEAYNLDRTAPVILSIARLSPLGEATNLSSIVYRLTFDEPVNPATLTTSDFTLVAVSGSISGTIASLTPVAGNGNRVFDIAISGITGAGSLRLDFTGSVSDVPGNLKSTGYSGGDTYVIDRSPPSVVSIDRVGAATTFLSTAQFIAVFSEPIDPATLNPQDFSLTRTGTAGGSISSIVPVTGNPSAFTINLTGLIGAGSVRPDIVAGASINDLAGNALQGGFSFGNSVTLAPTLARLSPASATEGIAVAFVVSINQILDVDLSVTVSPVATAGAAEAGTDFDGSQKVVVIPAGSLSATAEIPTVSDNLVERDEVFDLVVASVSATGRNTGIELGVARGTIVNDDFAVVSIADSSAAEGSNIVFVARLTNPVDSPVSFSFGVAGSITDTATGDDLQISQGGIVTIAAGQISATFQITTIQDDVVERDETVTISARGLTSGGRAVSMPRQSATGTIANDDAANLTLVAGSAIEGALVPVRLVLDKRVDTDVTLRLTPVIAPGDTASRRDFADMPLSVVIPAGSQSGTAFLPTIQDNLVERDESLTLTGSQLNARGRSVQLATPSTRATIINDDKAMLRIAPLGAVRGQAAVFSATINPGTPTVVSARIEMPFPGFTGALSIAQADVNDDGFTDVIYGAGAGLAGGQVRIFDGANGFLMTTISAFPGITRGVVVATGDVDGNGVKDIVVAAQGTAGLVRAFDARNRVMLRSFTAFPGYSGEVAISAGDTNGDRVDDIAVSVANGRLRVLSGTNGAVLRDITAFRSGSKANSVTLADLNGDGLREIVVGAAAGAPGIMVYPSLSGVPASFNAYSSAFKGGVIVSAIDINGDGIDEIFAATGPGTRGMVRVFNNSFSKIDEFFASQPGVINGLFIG